jgi:hypothetical protein
MRSILKQIQFGDDDFGYLPTAYANIRNFLNSIEKHVGWLNTNSNSDLGWDEAAKKQLIRALERVSIQHWNKNPNVIPDYIDRQVQKIIRILSRGMAK